MIISYNQRQQIKILNACNTPAELITIKELLEELKPIEPTTQLVYDRMMNFLLSTNPN